MIIRYVKNVEEIKIIKKKRLAQKETLFQRE